MKPLTQEDCLNLSAFIDKTHDDGDMLSLNTWDAKRLIYTTLLAYKMKEVVEFYAEAKILFISKNGDMPKANDPFTGVISGFQPSTVHIKDDGNNARAALKLWEQE